MLSTAASSPPTYLNALDLGRALCTLGRKHVVVRLEQRVVALSGPVDHEIGLSRVSRRDRPAAALFSRLLPPNQGTLPASDVPCTPLDPRNALVSPRSVHSLCAIARVQDEMASTATLTRLAVEGSAQLLRQSLPEDKVRGLEMLSDRDEVCGQARGE